MASKKLQKYRSIVAGLGCVICREFLNEHTEPCLHHILFVDYVQNTIPGRADFTVPQETFYDCTNYPLSIIYWN